MGIDARWQVDVLRLSTSAREMEWRGDARIDADIAFTRASRDEDCLIVEWLRGHLPTKGFCCGKSGGKS